MFVKHVCPPKLKCHCDLDLWPRNPKFNRGHLLVMTKHHTKLEDPLAMSSLVTDWTRFVYRQTDMQSNIPPFLQRRGGGHNYHDSVNHVYVILVSLVLTWFNTNMIYKVTHMHLNDNILLLYVSTLSQILIQHLWSERHI